MSDYKGLQSLIGVALAASLIAQVAAGVSIRSHVLLGALLAASFILGDGRR